MSNHFSMGAINKNTNSYEYPKIANKINKYKCPFCDKDVIFRNGSINQPHFAHYKSNNPCNYYERPNESQIHKDAKLLMKKLLDSKSSIFIERDCNYCEKNEKCEKNKKFYNDNYEYIIFSDEYTENTKIYLEYKFTYNNSVKIADVAVVENDKIKYIFEICNTNKTSENNRPEPWFEIKAEDLINKINSGENIDEDGNIDIKCIRKYKCESCKYIEEQDQIKKEIELIKIENEFRKKERIRQQQIKQQMKQQKEYESEFIKRIELEKIKQNKKNELEKICSSCNINYCKCLTNNFINNKCIKCNKLKCNCIKITNFFNLNT
jgi:hypothetical protein